MHEKLRVRKTVTMGANLHCLIYSLLIVIVFPTLFAIGDVLNTKGLVVLTEYQQVSWRLIKVENCDNKNYQRHTWPNLILLFIEIYSFTNNFDFK